MGNVAVFDTDSTIPADRFSYALNRYLPDDVIIQKSDEVAADFHPRHCDTKKTYCYRILNTQFGIPQKRNYTWNVAGNIDIEKMKTAAQYLIGEHMASINHPLLGDEVYGPKQKPFATQGQVLHAGVLGFEHPITGEYMEWHADLPDYFQGILKRLR